VLAGGLDPALTNVGALMRRPAIIADETEESSAVIARMRSHGVRRIPVVDRRGAVSGIVTLDDLLRHLADEVHSLLAIVDVGLHREQRARR
ncbi:MAG: CBS domain-containing protein, partial [Gammaproteobacteria bacterium]|nr:CBS domain-containing protein [Gammaproteobacteria bacterium]